MNQLTTKKKIMELKERHQELDNEQLQKYTGGRRPTVRYEVDNYNL
ncbi:hypothetical protein [Chryseobacterium oncorhynchi]|nr:hypothetical protein [Chryseobacterium oncorhynchi]